MLAVQFRHSGGAIPNTLAIAYTFLSYSVGVYLIASASWLVNAVGVAMIAHAMVVATCLIHECAHNTVFRSNYSNELFGELLGWIAGSCYAPFSAIRQKHMRHHIDKADVVPFDYKKWLRAQPSWVVELVHALEWAYIPAVEFIVHAYVLVHPFRQGGTRANRRRVIAVASVRWGLLGFVCWYSPQILMMYLLAWVMALHLLRYADGFQHTYDVIEPTMDDVMDTIRDQHYEQKNTYSNLVSLRYPVMNLPWLNFLYHNAHHARPTAPWYELPRLHSKLFSTDSRQILTLRDLIPSYHRNRVTRVLHEGYGEVGKGNDRAVGFIGAYGVSFLTAV